MTQDPPSQSKVSEPHEECDKSKLVCSGPEPKNSVESGVDEKFSETRSIKSCQVSGFLLKPKTGRHCGTKAATPLPSPGSNLTWPRHLSGQKFLSCKALDLWKDPLAELTATSFRWSQRSNKRKCWSVSSGVTDLSVIN